MTTEKASAKAKGFEVHVHSFVSGPRSRGGYDRKGLRQTGKFSHSHEGGDVSHCHPDTGPSTYVIDKDDWLRTTGLRGGRRKKFTAEPSGEQMPYVARTREETAFEVHVAPPPADWPANSTGGGMAAASRMILGSKLHVSNVVPIEPERRHRRA